MIWPVVLFRISGQIQNTTFPGKGGSFIPHPLQISVPSIPLSRCLLNLYTYPDLSRSTTPPNFRNIGTNADVMKRFSENKICFPFPFENKTNDEKVWKFFEIFTKQRRLWRSNCISPRSPTFLRPFRICCHIWNPTFPGGGTTDYSQKKLTFGYVTCRRSWPYTLDHIVQLPSALHWYKFQNNLLKTKKLLTSEDTCFGKSFRERNVFCISTRENTCHNIF